MLAIESIRHYTESLEEVVGAKDNCVIQSVDVELVHATAGYLLERLKTCHEGREVEEKEFEALSKKLHEYQVWEFSAEKTSIEAWNEIANSLKDSITKCIFINEVELCDEVRVGVMRAQVESLCAQWKSSEKEWGRLPAKVDKMKADCAIADKVCIYVAGNLDPESVHPAVVLLEEKLRRWEGMKLAKVESKVAYFSKKLDCFDSGIKLNQKTAEKVECVRLKLQQKLGWGDEKGDLVKLSFVKVYDLSTNLLNGLNGGDDFHEKVKQVRNLLGGEEGASAIEGSLRSLSQVFESHLRRIAPGRDLALEDYSRAAQCIRVESLLMLLEKQIREQAHSYVSVVSNVLEGVKMDPRDLPVGVENFVYSLHVKVYELCNEEWIKGGKSQKGIDPNHWKFQNKFGRIALQGADQEAVTDRLVLDGIVSEDVGNDPFHYKNVQAMVSKKIKMKALRELMQLIKKAWS